MVLRFMRHDEKPKELEINIFGEKMNFSTGGVMGIKKNWKSKIWIKKGISALVV